jgi:hypothetical protein
MSYAQKRITPYALSLFDAFEENTQTRTRLSVAAAGIVVTAGMVHLTYPELGFRKAQDQTSDTNL